MRYSIMGATVEQVRNAGGQNVKEASRTGIIFADIDEAGVALLESIGARVKKVGEVKSSDFADVTPPAPILEETGYSPLDLMNALGFTDDWRHIIEPPLYGEGFAVAVLDSGIRSTHEMLGGRVVRTRNFTSSPSGDAFSHGTGVASIIHAIAPRSDIVDIKVIGDDGLGSDEAVIMGIEEVIRIVNNHEIPIRVINLSLGKEDDGDPFDPLRVACRAAIEEGLFVIAAAGNSGPNPGTIMSPACEQYVVAVGSVNYDHTMPEWSFRVSSFSSRGPTREGLTKPDVVLPGEKIVMADSKSDTATCVKSGTSFATPIGAGMFLIYSEGVLKEARRVMPGLEWNKVWVPVTPFDAIDVWMPLITAKPTEVPRGKDADYGWGIPFAELATLAFTGGMPSQITGNIMDMVVPIVGIGIMGMMMSSIAKSLK